MEFSFGVLSFNKEKYILETLESIKYQILHFGKDIKFNIFITDDCSIDNSVRLIKNWLSENASLFEICQLIENSQNMGTTYNYEVLLNKIKSNYFKVIAADDIFAADNIFEDMNNSESNVFNVTIPIFLNNDTLYFDQGVVRKHFFFQNKKRDNSYDINKMIYGGYFVTPSIFLSRNLINEKCIKFMRQFFLFEDDPTWYMVLKNNKNISVNFINSVKVIYRVNSGVSNTCSNPVWNSDFEKFSKIVCKENPSFLLKLYKKSKAKHLNHMDSKFSFCFIFDKVNAIFFKIYYFLLKNNELHNFIHNEKIKNLSYYKELKKIALSKYVLYMKIIGN
ncbi:MAG: glycosyltransferase [Succinivibrio sp.]|nr:glycosyltransferase [Succinivibrio sp.]